ncbi:MAG: DUF4163 domain-containing protein [Clostridia bacterium]|nr:DUF4163 domain-containing protein [Clostridia bacterium]
MKKVLSILTAALLIMSCISVFAENDVTVVVDGQTVSFDQPPIIENGRTLVPMRAIFEALGCDVDYYEGEDGSQNVFANKGGKNISLQIGSADMYTNGDTVTLDVPAKIVGDRTLVPVRAISEALEAAVDWNGNTKTVTVESKRGAHRFVTQKITENQTGAYTLEASAKYPILYADTECPILAAINAEIKKDAEDFIEEATSLYAEIDAADADIIPEDARQITYEMDYDITLDRNNLLSIVEYYYMYTGGAHPNSHMVGKVYNLNDGSKIALTDILNTEAVDLDAIIAEGITKYFDGDTTYASLAVEEKENAGYYLTDDSLVIFYVPYQIASYAAGYPTFEVPFSPAAFKFDLSGYNLPELNLNLDGNITTAYEWIQASENDKLTVIREYEEQNTDLLGAPGVFKFNIKGKKPGFTELKLRYRRPYETDALKTLIYKLRVENNLNVTICASEIIQ